MKILRYFALLSGLFLTATAQADTPFITVASTTSTANSGLFDTLLPPFEKQSGIEVRVVAVGTGKAIRLAKNGDADVLLVHHKASEEAFVEAGYGVERFDVMYNDFVLIGPKADPANIKNLGEIHNVFSRVAKAKAAFVSRGDDSGTHKKELGLWRNASVNVNAASGSWYRETGSGMGATLNTASAMNAYTLSDRATWLKFGNKGDLEILFEGDEQMFNQYGVILVNPKKHAHIKANLGQEFIDWLRSDEGQQLIRNYHIAGNQAFFPNAQ